MLKISIATWIANAAACLTGVYGDVTHQAEAVDCGRRTVSDQAHKVQAAVAAEHACGPTRAEPNQEDHDLRHENARLWDWLAQTVEFPPAKPREFTVTATAMGLSLNQVLVPLALVLGAKARPGRSTIQRGIPAAGQAAGRALKHLDGQCEALVRVGRLDEIFVHRRPVLVGVEPASMVWFLGRKVDDRTGATGPKAWHDWTALSYVLADAGTGLPAGIAAVPQQRRKDVQPALENGLDVFHTTREARRALRLNWDRGERLWERAAWTKAETAFQQDEQSEGGGTIAHAAPRVFRPEGQWNDRTWARPRIAQAPSQLSGREWSQVRGFLQTGATWTFLDRPHRRLQEAVPQDQVRGELVRLWWPRRQRPRATPAGVIAGVGHVAHLVQQVVCQKSDAHWPASYRKVAQVFHQTVRASSAVECMNSVLRVHLSRHRTLTRDLLDLKRLDWNCRMFRGGKRRGRCPYEHLGLKLPSYDFWGLLRGEMITAITEAKAKAKVKATAKAA